jgi:protein-L-isoaspartate(D-aspartate) O-methyltransferase
LKNHEQEAIINDMGTGDNDDRYAAARQRMLKHDLQGRDIKNANVLQAMAEVSREEFIPQEYLSQAYSDGPLPIGMGQTISQPYIVALMTQVLQVNCDCEVLEVGTGSGYQTAVLSKLAKKVYTIEKFRELSESAQRILSKLSIANVEFHVGDGSCGWPESQLPKAGCFDRIIITAAVPSFPEPLIKQICKDGLITGPIGGQVMQELVVGKKRAGKIAETSICGCRFVKLVGKYGFEQ